MPIQSATKNNIECILSNYKCTPVHLDSQVKLKFQTAINNRLSYINNESINLYVNYSGEWEYKDSSNTNYEGVCIFDVDASGFPVDIYTGQFIAEFIYNTEIYLSNIVRVNVI